MSDIEGKTLGLHSTVSSETDDENTRLNNKTHSKKTEKRPQLRKSGYFPPPAGMGMSELKMSHWIFHVPPDFFEKFIHLPWSMWEPSAPMISYVPVPELRSPLLSSERTRIL